jgi:predicted ABC-type transport system involved in lysophospholipase L1 biosynthesis ATPase subunit
MLQHAPVLPALELNLRWHLGGFAYGIEACCVAGLYQLAGPGTSWLLRALATGEACDFGTAVLDGEPLRTATGDRPVGAGSRPVVAWLADDLPPMLPALQWVKEPVRAQGVPREAAMERARQALRWLGALHLAPRPLRTLSPPDLQRVALARALAHVPGLLLLERPDAPFEPDAQAALYALLARFAAEWEIVVLLAPVARIEGVPALPLLC